MRKHANRLIAALSPADAEAVIACLEPVQAERGDVLHDQGEQVRYVYFPHSGMISSVAVKTDAVYSGSSRSLPAR